MLQLNHKREDATIFIHCTLIKRKVISASVLLLLLLWLQVPLLILALVYAYSKEENISCKFELFYAKWRLHFIYNIITTSCCVDGLVCSSYYGKQGAWKDVSPPVHEENLHFNYGRVYLPSESGLPKYLDDYLYIYFHITILMDFMLILQWNTGVTVTGWFIMSNLLLMPNVLLIRSNYDLNNKQNVFLLYAFYGASSAPLPLNVTLIL